MICHANIAKLVKISTKTIGLEIILGIYTIKRDKTEKWEIQKFQKDISYRNALSQKETEVFKFYIFH